MVGSGCFGRSLIPGQPDANLQLAKTPLLIVKENFWGGIFILLGTSAYRSCKRRMLGLRESTWVRKLLEVVGVLVIVPHALWLFHPKEFQAHPLVPLMIIPWILVAYLVIVVRSWVQKRKNQING